MAKKRTVKKIVVKANRTKELFNQKKLYASIHRSCLSVELSRKDCDQLAKHIYQDALKMLEKEQCLLSEEISAAVAKAMHKRKKELAFMYKTHRDLS